MFVIKLKWNQRRLKLVYDREKKTVCFFLFVIFKIQVVSTFRLNLEQIVVFITQFMKQYMLIIDLMSQ